MSVPNLILSPFLIIHPPNDENWVNTTATGLHQTTGLNRATTSSRWLKRATTSSHNYQPDANTKEGSIAFPVTAPLRLQRNKGTSVASSDTLQRQSRSPLFGNFNGSRTFLNGSCAHTQNPFQAGVAFKRATSLHALSNLDLTSR